MAIDFKESYPIISWDLNKRNLFFKYFGKKSDSARGFKVQILQDQILLIPSTETLRFYCVKSDGAKVYIDAVIDDAYFIINLTNQVFAVRGLVSCELQLNSGGEWLTSDTFGITVSDNLMDGSIVSSNDFIALQNALNQVDNLESTYAPRLTNVETSKIDKASIVNNTITTAEGTVLDGRMGKNLQDQVTTINNKMDKGIDDLDNAIEDIYGNKIDKANIANNLITTTTGLVLDASQGKNLQDQITEQNNNLANKTSKTYQGTITGDFKNTVQENWSTIPVGMSLCLLAQGTLVGATVYKQGNSYGTVLIMPYTESNPTYGRLSNNVWTWKTVTLT